MAIILLPNDWEKNIYDIWEKNIHDIQKRNIHNRVTYIVNAAHRVRFISLTKAFIY